MNLFFREVGEGTPIVILHGLFGSSDNWLSIAKVLAEKHKVYSLDQRNHGQSPPSDLWNYDVMVEDLREFLIQHQIDTPVIIGHSMGGKVAMQFAISYPEMLAKLIVVDIAPKYYPVHHDTILEGLNSIDLNALQSRNEADQQLSRYVPEIGTRQFLLKNLARTPEGFQWKINLPVIEQNIEGIGVGLNAKEYFDKPTEFIRGANSNYIKDEDEFEIKSIFPNSILVTIANAGHWVHAEQPEVFLEKLKAFID